MFAINSVLKINPWIYKIKDLIGEKIINKKTLLKGSVAE